jgi:hypothetical protein
MGKYDHIASAKVTKSGQFFIPGRYKVRISAVKEVASQMGKDFTIIETTVLQSNNPDVPVGASRSHVIDMNNVMGIINIKAFVAAASGVDPTLETVNDQVEAYWKAQDPHGVYRSFAQIVEDLIVKANILEGAEMDLECVAIRKRDGDPFTKYNWAIRHDQ